ncbi:SRPBCC family protein [Macrococcus animalis]|uniref:SRPBCC family protein n=1 Tax=Macrococcus animalis TaxID=3395467 RepID=UPI0039BE5EAD
MTQLADIKKTIVLEHPIEKVWQAIATREGINGWWMPNTFEPVEGKSFTLSAGAYGESECKVTEIIEHEKVAFDWAKDWHMTFLVNAIDTEQTEFTMIHSGWDDGIETEFNQPHAVVRGFMADGWEKIVNEGLSNYLNK